MRRSSIIALVAAGILAAPLPTVAGKWDGRDAAPKEQTRPPCSWVVVSKSAHHTDSSGRVVYLVRERNTCTGAIRGYFSF